MTTVWVIETHYDDMLSAMIPIAVVAKVGTGRRIADNRLGPQVRKQRIWKHVRPGLWCMYWNRRHNAAIVSQLKRFEVQ